jgi:hypothetical protein
MFKVGDESEDFTLPHRFQVDFRWTPGGLSLAESPAKLWSKSTWTPPGLQMDYMDCVDSTPPHAYDPEEVDSTWILADSTWTLVLK